jgi:hypothetical protein
VPGIAIRDRYKFHFSAHRFEQLGGSTCLDIAVIGMRADGNHTDLAESRAHDA